MYPATKIERFKEQVELKYQLYNSIFITLPFRSIDNTGVLLPLFTEICEEGFKNGKSPDEIFNEFADKYLQDMDEQARIGLMFRFIQYVERQIVLFDAIEDAAYETLNNLEGAGSLRESREKAEGQGRIHELREFLKHFSVRPVLTAHPTQFYPGSVLGIITDLTEAIKQNNLNQIKDLLAQLGKTPFIKKEKPTPYDEAVSLLWYLENMFYPAAGDINHYIQDAIYKDGTLEHSPIALGFWPGGDRDGNPFVTNEITLKVADRLRTSILNCYYTDIRTLKRRLTFNSVQDKIAMLEDKLYRSVFYSKGEIFIELDELKATLQEIRTLIVEQHQSLYLDLVDGLINKVNQFGFHFASLDIRQNSKIHNAVFADVIDYLSKNDTSLTDYEKSDEKAKLEALGRLDATIAPEDFEGDTKSTLESILAIKTIQQRNGQMGCNRYIISNNESALNVLELLAMFDLLGFENPPVDIVPLFETVDDLEEAGHVMELLYTNAHYAAHLKRRGNRQTIMLGFSDGTKDGGYLMANWGIFKAKENLTQMARNYDVKVVFFDGRGGPPARGGGKTHKYYASQGASIENNEIQITIQGQTISSNFGTLDSCRFNLENLLSAGITNGVFEKEKKQFTQEQHDLVESLGQLGYEKYKKFKAHPKFLPYLEKMSTLNYYAKTNIGSRPAKRNKGSELDFADLRAIPFVGSWSQLKQNVPGFFGVGHALGHYEKEGRWEEVQALYHNSLFFRTLLENSMMSLTKSFFPLTAYMKDDEEFGAFWQIIYDEFKETERLLLKISGYKELMENYPDGRASIKLREHIVVPLLTIQQYALNKIRQMKNGKEDDALLETYEKIVTRSLFGNINAARNSA
ncbi:phosphoenolpyruvate carboxylase [Flavobacterium akiainvivens]|uniref:Phosphoenolpyruvate carboxylase n=1 Tax=Flavobacterium akiainvivens TaxID=1202724 RepID=A0A0M9VH68_9FLAO|nr:phosphoenolpyruvate carboxylase [Flavobacterium akiainvivens]KOS05240.1 phosphoenolpyruvate carboxylase [Flavobacterium akiainvivens]SFQ50285.1 Phosphoenolpyruvate carboxylase, type 1 [Flavobacterium akiainvivens]